MLPYRYRSLRHPDSIRLLILHPSSDDSAPLVCTLEDRRLSDKNLDYEAVSYTWGDTSQQHAIQLHGGRRSLSVKGNCCNVLRYLRQHHSDRVLWIDAICINQEDLGERSSQVRMMDKVYDLASGVVVHLGEETAGSRILFDELAEADALLSKGLPCKRPRPSERVIREIDMLFERPWFKRVWVLQEVYNKDRVTFMCSSLSASENALRALSFGYVGTRVHKKRRPRPFDLIRSHPSEDMASPQLNLWAQLYESRGCLASDPRDRVFALKAMLGSQQSRMDHLIDYKQSPEQVFVETARFLLPVVGLRILTATRHPHNRNMSSWIPDWSQNLPVNGLIFLTANIMEPTGDSFTIDSIPGATEACLELRSFGCRFGQVAHLSSIYSFNGYEDAAVKFNSLMQVSNARGNNSESMDEMGQEIIDAITRFRKSRLAYSLSRSWGFVFKDENYIIDSGHEVAHYFFQSLQQCRLVLSSGGNLAIAPAAVECGDVFCLLSGAATASILRPVPDGTWTLISGDCYMPHVPDNGDEPSWIDDYVSEHPDEREVFRIR
ncbi:heterokaryon incompatibility protein-domain-containing protein [Paraphoma chrysanthemicola]|uniref:Heterokaryon incompatibility protein-domain-containing protein n=1 Tax=Paraphoma chrysanthemicola TaxID=798071 RepID=A0A8K0VRN2_9PLEO|nr:heterokaryon incompatibility protein-domain-containing protein [Paraphoma chrysanthemicola]